MPAATPAKPRLPLAVGPCQSPPLDSRRTASQSRWQSDKPRPHTREHLPPGGAADAGLDDPGAGSAGGAALWRSLARSRVTSRAAWRPAYRWMAREMRGRLGAPQDRQQMPIWLWCRWRGAAQPRPDLRHRGHLPKGIFRRASRTRTGRRPHAALGFRTLALRAERLVPARVAGGRARVRRAPRPGPHRAELAAHVRSRAGAIVVTWRLARRSPSRA